MARTTGAGRARKTVRFDATILEGCIDEAVQLECERRRAGRALVVAAAPGNGNGSGNGVSPAERAFVRDALLALLKAFCDAAQPAGGLPLDDLLEPRDLQGLLARGQANAIAGECRPKLLTKARLRQPVDLRLALAAMHFFRFVLQRPSFGLFALGAVESDRLIGVQRIERALRAARFELPAGALEAIGRRAGETAAYAYVSEAMSVHYGGLRARVDDRGVLRLHLTCTTRHWPVRLHGFAGRLMPTRTYEWYEWARVPSARLTVRVLDAGGERRLAIPTVKRLDHRRGLVVFEIDPATPPQTLAALVVPGAGEGGSRHEVIWEEELVLNAADRDIVVSYQPVTGLRISVDAALARDVHVTIGDSPAVLPAEGAWTLGRALMPREVVAVRFRHRSLGEDVAHQLGASGEWYVGGGSEMARAAGAEAGQAAARAGAR